MFRRLWRWWRWKNRRYGYGRITLAQVDEALKHDYLPAIREQLSNSNTLLKMLGPQTPEAVAEMEARLAAQQAEDEAFAPLITYLRTQIDSLPPRQRELLDDEWDD